MEKQHLRLLVGALALAGGLAVVVPAAHSSPRMLDPNPFDARTDPTVNTACTQWRAQPWPTAWGISTWDNGRRVQGGAAYGNADHQLPAGAYREYDVPGGGYDPAKKRGLTRLVRAAGGEVYLTVNHHHDFRTLTHCNAA
ncbi:hypothetical protein [Kitasatospora sp. NPDC018619]|uniref:hypothetical protein n=1 Tax=unclassified Kitasatospora TaxID=2633591 RepID=UPI0037B7CA3D